MIIIATHVCQSFPTYNHQNKVIFKWKYLLFTIIGLTINETSLVDPRGRPQVSRPYVHPKTSQKSLPDRTVGLAKWIFDDFCLVCY